MLLAVLIIGEVAGSPYAEKRQNYHDDVIVCRMVREYLEPPLPRPRR